MSLCTCVPDITAPTRYPIGIPLLFVIVLSHARNKGVSAAIKLASQDEEAHAQVGRSHGERKKEKKEKKRVISYSVSH
jgi:hypothetical protein